MTEEELRKLRRLASCAARLLEDKEFREVLADLKNIAIRKWSDAGKTADREAAWFELHAAGGLENLLKKYGERWRTEAKKHGLDG